MTAPIHCRACPFAGCVWCEHKGGTQEPEPEDDD